MKNVIFAVFFGAILALGTLSGNQSSPVSLIEVAGAATPTPKPTPSPTPKPCSGTINGAPYRCAHSDGVCCYDARMGYGCKEPLLFGLYTGCSQGSFIKQ